MKTSITGGNGKLAAYVIRELAPGHEIVLFARHRPADEFAKYPWIQGDLNDFDDCCRAVAGVEAIQQMRRQSDCRVG